MYIFLYMESDEFNPQHKLLENFDSPILGAFTRFEKIPISFLITICLSIRLSAWNILTFIRWIFMMVYRKGKKVKLSLCIINWGLHHEDVRESKDIGPPFLTSAVDGADWSASRPCRFTPREIAPGTHCIGGYERYGEEKNIAPAGNRTPAIQPIT
jgi:hypothetical protein